MVGTHHLEYGFPSTHSANSLSLTFFLELLVQTARPYIALLMYDDHPRLAYLLNETYLLEGLISLYAFTIVYGRLYSGMHTVLGAYRRWRAYQRLYCGRGYGGTGGVL